MDKVIWQTQLTESNVADVEGVGQVRASGSNSYRWVKNNYASTVYAGNAVFHTFADGANFHKYIADGATADLAAMAGVVASSSIATGEYGWVQIFGYNASVSNYASGGTAIVVGDWLIGVNSQLYAIHGTTMGTAPAHARGILALEALANSVTTVSAKKGFVHCM